MVDTIAKAACSLPPSDAGPSPLLSCSLSKVRAATFLTTSHLMDCQRAVSVSIQHYDAFRHHRYRYRRRGLMFRRHNVVSARLRLGYRPVWQVAGVEDESHFSSCPLCHSPNVINTLEHYCLSCPEVSDMLPRGQPLLDIYRHLLVHDNLEALLARYPRFDTTPSTSQYLQAAHGVLEEQRDGTVVGVCPAASHIIRDGGGQWWVVVDPQQSAITWRLQTHSPMSGREEIILQALTWDRNPQHLQRQ
ncbi:hypothetical protein GWK47_030553 [Chionoecetes opilio]|uniref:Uncharacterized protein n=1 Tax=Chionoecetes opilio TaxID=41210 RepID=A0A8J5D560_CHIOP|nr:hypothetical protein GWK47_030553 [Chionoecetes opilio]